MRSRKSGARCCRCAGTWPSCSDKRRAEGKTLGALEGIPILLKDNIDAVGMPTTAGSFALEFNVPKQDSEVVRRLRAAGAIILGKANLSQFAGWRPAAERPEGRR